MSQMDDNKQIAVWFGHRIPNSKHDNKDRVNRNWRKCFQGTFLQYCSCCSESASIGLVIGSLLFGVAFATALTLYLTKTGSDSACNTASTINSSMTAAMITGNTTSTSNVISTTSDTTTTTTSPFNVNLITNGDGETGSCQTGSGITSPTGWSFSGPIMQVIYSSPYYNGQLSTSPGSNTRGLCYFFGQISSITTMWQTIDLTKKFSTNLLDNGTMYFNLSAWMGGTDIQDDSVSMCLTFIDQANQMLGSAVTVGPVLANQRANITSLIFQQVNGLVPIGTRSINLLVTMTFFYGIQNNAAIDDISLSFY